MRKGESPAVRGTYSEKGKQDLTFALDAFHDDKNLLLTRVANVVSDIGTFLIHMNACVGRVSCEEVCPIRSSVFFFLVEYLGVKRVGVGVGFDVENRSRSFIWRLYRVKVIVDI